MRKRIFDVIELSDGNNILSSVYDFFMMFVIFISIIPLCFKGTYKLSEVIELFCLIIFIVDYLLRWFTADYKYNKKTIWSFVRYPFGWLAIVDLIAILPSISAINSGFKLFKLFRMMRAFRVFRVFKALRYSKSIKIIISVLKRSRESLIAVAVLAVSYIIISALVIFNVEPNSFENFFDAIYWATISLTTVGYGDIYPITTIGRIVTMISSVLGIAIVALPAGIITAGYMQEIENEKNNFVD